MFEDVQSFAFLGVTVYKYGLFLSIGTALWLCLCGFLAHKRGVSIRTVLLTGVLSIPMGLIFARITFSLISLAYYLETIGQPVAMLYFWDGGLSMMGTLLGVSLAAWIVAKVKKVPYGTLMDVLAVPAGVFLAFARLGEAYTTLGRGKIIENQWLQDIAFFGIKESWSDDVFHAVFRYEAAIAILLFIVMLILFYSKAIRARAKQGDLTLIFGALFGSSQVVLESLRDDGHLLWGFVRASQVISILLPVAAIVVFSTRLIKREGVSTKMVASWVLAVASIALGIIKEFDIDTSNNLLREYAMMSLGMAVLALTAVYLWRTATDSRLHA